MMTESAIDVRVLGQSRNVTVPNNFFVLINGNNLQLLGDLPRRSLKCRLDAGVENPELRVFKSEHPLIVARRDRGKLVAAALAIMLAYRRAGSPPQSSPALGSFGQWSREVRDALLWIGKPDPVSTQAAIRSVDRRLASHEMLMAEWFKAKCSPDGCRTVGVTAKRLVELANETARGENGFPAGWDNPELREALLSIAPHRNGRDIDGQRLGSFLSAIVGKIVGGHRIERDGSGHGGLVYWIVEKVNAA
jgi:putative DNA primase/helicase